jgi:hypothetical protein
MTPNPTTKGMSEAEVLAVVDRAIATDEAQVAIDARLGVSSPATEAAAREMRAARSTIESTFAELAEKRERMVSILDLLAREIEAKDALYSELARVKAEREENLAAGQAAANRAERAESALSTLRAERDAAFAMSRCECGGDEVCRNLSAMHADRTALRAEVEGLRKAAKAVRPYIATQPVGCHGDKCREPWCYSCCGEDEADKAAQKGADAAWALDAALSQPSATRNAESEDL